MRENGLASSSILSLEAAFERKGSFDDLPARCPHCGAHGVFREVGRGYMQDPARNVISAPPEISGFKVVQVTVGRCPGCAGLTVGAALSAKDGKTFGRLLWPSDCWPDSAPSTLEGEIKRAYDEARFALQVSPMGAAVLARRCLQHVIRAKMGIKKKRLFDEIAEAITRPELTKPTKGALDHIREIGNWGAHPTPTDVDPAETIIEVNRAEAEYTLQVLELLFHDLYTVPERIAAMNATIKARK